MPKLYPAECRWWHPLAASHLLPIYVQNALIPSVVARPLHGEVPTIDLVMGYNKSNTSPLLKRFYKLRADELTSHEPRDTKERNDRIRSVKSPITRRLQPLVSRLNASHHGRCTRKDGAIPRATSKECFNLELTRTFSEKPANLPHRFRYTGNREIDEAPAIIRGRFYLLVIHHCIRCEMEAVSPLERRI